MSGPVLRTELGETYSNPIPPATPGTGEGETVGAIGRKQNSRLIQPK